MSGIRKFRRQHPRPLHREKPARRLLLRDVFLIGGITLAIAGVFWGGRQYQLYTIGSPEHVLNTRFGTEYVPEVEAGEPGHLAAAIAAFTAGGIGVALSVLALVARLIDKRLDTAREDGAGVSGADGR